jgi:peptidoglycan/LPS O-acetylase OafA/YrhL
MSGDPSSRPAERLLSIQALRAVAALLVVAGHLQALSVHQAASLGIDVSAVTRIPGGFGVDVFFVISGLIMVVTTRDLVGRPSAATTFLVRRLVRLVPLYWAATFAFVGMRFAARGTWSADALPALLASLAFVPFRGPDDPAGLAYPVLSLGWSLNYELFFYAIFALALALPRRFLAVVFAALPALAAIGEFVSPEAVAPYFWTRPIVLEFGFGVAAGVLCTRRAHAVRAVALTVTAAAALWVLCDPFGMLSAPAGSSTPNDLTRVLAWGLPAAVIVGFAALRERARAASSSQPGVGTRTLAVLGDWSYALYLTHSFVLGALAMWWKARPPAGGFEIVASAALACALSIAVAGAVHVGFERPASRWLGTRLRRRAPSRVQMA